MIKVDLLNPVQRWELWKLLNSKAECEVCGKALSGKKYYCIIEPSILSSEKDSVIFYCKGCVPSVQGKRKKRRVK